MIERKEEFSEISQVVVKKNNAVPLTFFFKKEIRLKNKLACKMFISCEAI